MLAYEVVIIDEEYQITTLYGEYTDHEDAMEGMRGANREIEDEDGLYVEIREIH